MKHKIYMRDWYFNAGIVGFLATLNNWKEDLSQIQGVEIGENFIEFENDVLEGFHDKFIKKLFFQFFNTRLYQNKLKSVLKELKEKKVKNPYSKIKEVEEKGQYKDLLKALNIDYLSLENKEKEEVIKGLEENIIKTITNCTKENIFNIVSENNKELILNFVSLKLKGVSSHQNILKYINNINNLKDNKKLKTNEFCPSCQTRKYSVDFSNAISNLIGFNTDNKNWIWGYKDTKTKICPVCALIYHCAIISFGYSLKKIDKNWVNFFYFINRNTNLKNLYSAVAGFIGAFQGEKEKKQPVYLMIRESIKTIKKEQTRNISENINFLEIIDNPILSSQSGKGYNIYNYNISKKAADFLNEYFSGNDKRKLIPFGYYIINKTYYHIEEELLILTINNQISFSNLNKYFSIHYKQFL